MPRADTIPTVSATLRVDEGDVLLSAEFAFSLTPALEDALEKGIRSISRSSSSFAHALHVVSEKVAEWSIPIASPIVPDPPVPRVERPARPGVESLEDVSGSSGMSRRAPSPTPPNW